MEQARRAYIEDLIDVEEFEQRVDNILRGFPLPPPLKPVKPAPTREEEPH
jgi:hypothetical protein